MSKYGFSSMETPEDALKNEINAAYPGVEQKIADILRDFLNAQGISNPEIRPVVILQSDVLDYHALYDGLGWYSSSKGIDIIINLCWKLPTGFLGLKTRTYLNVWVDTVMEGERKEAVHQFGKVLRRETSIPVEMCFGYNVVGQFAGGRSRPVSSTRTKTRVYEIFHKLCP